MLLSRYVPPFRAASPVFGFAAGSFATADAVAFAAGGGDRGLSTFFAGVLAFTFADALSNVGYDDAAAVAFAGGVFARGGAAGFAAAFAGGADGGCAVAFDAAFAGGG